MATSVLFPPVDLAAAKKSSGPNYDVYLGDALRLLLAFPDDHFDAVITDPPYSSGGMTRGDRMQDTVAKYANTQNAVEFAGDTRDQHSFGYWCTLWYAECLRVVKPGGFLFTFTDWRQIPATSDSLQAGGWVWRGMVGWNKTAAVRPSKGRPRNQMEYALWGTKGPHSPWEVVRDPVTGETRVQPFGTGPDEHVIDSAPCPEGFAEELPDGWVARDGFLEPAEVVQHLIPRADRHHIAQKPVGLLADLLRVTPPGSRVLDPFAGSGTTAVAAMKTDRHATLFEIMPTNLDLIDTRLRGAEVGQTVNEVRSGQVTLFGAAPVDD